MTSVLFVDDEVQVLEGIEDMLRSKRSGWSADFALGGQAALDRIGAGHHYDVVVSDMRMPGMNGAELLEQVRDLSPDTVRIVLSGYSEPGSALRAVPVAHEFLSKPCPYDALRGAVDRATQLRDAVTTDTIRSIISGASALPAAPQVFAELTALLSSAEPSTNEIAALVERDVAITAKLLQIVNSAFFGRSRRIGDVREAINLLGLALLRGLVLSVEVFNVFSPGEGSRFHLDRLERHASIVGAIACCLVPEEDRAEALAAGLLHDVGRLLLVAKRPEELDAMLDEHLATGRPLHEIETEQLGVSHAEIGGSLLALWGLPYGIVSAVAYHHEPERTGAAGIDTAAAVAIADALAHGQEPSEELLEREGAQELLARWRTRAAALTAAMAPGPDEDGTS